MYENLSSELLRFIEQSPSAFHAVDNLAVMLKDAGFLPLSERDPWKLKAGGRFFVTRNSSSLIAFHLPEQAPKGFHIAASHADSPLFKLKTSPEILSADSYVRLNVERYGGMLIAPWFDRPLSLAGRLFVREKKSGDITEKLVHIDRDLLIIPSLAIHFDREANQGHAYQVQQELLPLYGDRDSLGSLGKLLAKEAHVRQSDILGSDIYVCPRTKGTFVGEKGEYIASPRLDDLQCTYADTRGFLDAAKKKRTVSSCAVLAVFDNEEVGSTTRQGADASFLADTLFRISACFHPEADAWQRMLANSFMISADNAHAVHPAHAEKSDPVNRPKMNGGIVIKHSANQKYTTDAYSASRMRLLCEQAAVPFQDFVNHADQPGGSTLGNLSTRHVSVRTVDIGCAQLAMHSPYETAGAYDGAYLARVMKTFFESDLFAC